MENPEWLLQLTSKSRHTRSQKLQDQIAQIYLYQHVAKSLSEKEMMELENFSKTLQNDGVEEEHSLSYHNMFFLDARTGQHRFFGRRIRSLEDRQRELMLHKNRQYQWLLAEAYEAFEDFLVYTYAYVGMNDPDFWQLKDYGNISLNEIEGKEFQWFVSQIKDKKRDIPASILNQFRKKIPGLESTETNNNLEINLKLAITLIEKLRHSIVHTSGETNRANFIKIVLAAAGLENNGNHKEDDVLFIEYFFGREEYENTICLLEVPLDDRLGTYHDRFKKLCGYLLSYSCLIVEYLNADTSLSADQLN
jgi:hypothetical protein